MTNKPMLSVDREKHIRLQAEMGCRVDHRCTIDLLEEIKRLREINCDESANLCQVCNGFGRYQDGDSGTDEDGRCPNVVDCDCSESERMPEYQTPHSDDLAVDSFALSMKAKLAKSRDKGRGGWESCSGEELSKMLRDHVDKGDPVDVANFCMFLATMSLGIDKPAAQIRGNQMQFELVRDGIADFLADNMPMKKYTLAEVERMIKEVAPTPTSKTESDQ